MALWQEEGKARPASRWRNAQKRWVQCWHNVHVSATSKLSRQRRRNVQPAKEHVYALREDALQEGRGRAAQVAFIPHLRPNAMPVARRRSRQSGGRRPRRACACVPPCKYRENSKGSPQAPPARGVAQPCGAPRRKRWHGRHVVAMNIRCRTRD